MCFDVIPMTEYYLLECIIPDELPDKQFVESTKALLSFSRLMKCPCRQVQGENYWLVELPADPYAFCEAINAFEAFCPLYQIAHSLQCYPVETCPIRVK